MDQLQIYAALGYVLIVVGLAGSILPLLPGPLLIWAGIFLWAWDDNFVRIGWPTLTLLGLLALIAWGADIFLTAVVSRRAGASWRAIGGAILGGILGGAFLSALPIIGTLAGAVIGAVVGMWTVEYYAKNRNQQAATTAVRAYITSLLIGAGLEVLIALIMIAVFVWQAFYFI